MKQIYENDSTVYSYFFDWDTTELKYEKLTVYNYEYLDGMQWNIVDQYMMHLEYTETYWKFFKKKRQKTVRLPGLLISNDKIIAKIKLFQFTLEHFGYVIKNDRDYNPEPNLINVVSWVRDEMNKLLGDCPEKCLQAIDNIVPDEKNYSIWR